MVRQKCADIFCQKMSPFLEADIDITNSQATEYTVRLLSFSTFRAQDLVCIKEFNSIV